MSVYAPGTAPTDDSASGDAGAALFGDVMLPKKREGLDAGALAFLDSAKRELSYAAFTQCARWRTMRKIFDQLDGGQDTALSRQYHPDVPGLKADQQKRIRAQLRHVNLVQPALDRLVNSIHAGRITRKATKNKTLQKLLRSKRHGVAMTKLCENAFAYGTAVMVPVLQSRKRLRFWNFNPRYTVIVTDPLDVSEVVGVIELIPACTSGGISTGKLDGYRFVTSEVTGWYHGSSDKLEVTEHGLGIVPAVIAYGRDRRHAGEKYGGSLIEPAADATIDVTNNELALKILRDRFSQALLLVFGEPKNSAPETKESLQKFLMFQDKESGDAKYITPESQIEQMISLTKRLCTDAAVAMGLPLDTFLPETVTGSDASATAARNRAFPLQQRMVRLVDEWSMVEQDAAAMIGAVLEGKRIDADTEELVELWGVVIAILPSIPEAEAETLASWQQKTEKFFAPIEDAIEYYSGHLEDDAKERLAAFWKLMFEPSAGKADDELLKWKREIVKALFSDATTGDIMANLTKLGPLLEQTGLPRQRKYEEPWLPVVAASGPLVSGEIIKDSEGDVVGGDVVPPSASAKATADVPGDDDSEPTGEEAKGAPGEMPPALRNAARSGADEDKDDGEGEGNSGDDDVPEIDSSKEGEG